MKKAFLILLLSLVFLDAKSQDGFKVYHEIEIEALDMHLQIGHEIKEGFRIECLDNDGKLHYVRSDTPKNEATKEYPVNMIIRVLTEQGKLVKDIMIDFNDVDIDLSGFGIKYIGERKFITVNVGRFQRYILNLSNLKLIGPFQPHIDGAEFGDSQDNNAIFLKVFNNGQYLIGYLTGAGYFCYNLMDLYNPIQVDHYCTEYCKLKGKYFFLDKRAENIYNGIIIDSNQIKSVDSVYFLFQGERLEQDKIGKVITQNLKNNYLILNRIDKNSKKSPFAIDYSTGEIIDYEKIKQ